VIHHLVLFRFAPEARDELRARLAKLLDQLPGAVAEIRGWRHGANVTADAEAWDYALYASFDDEEALHAYFDHPAHLAVLDQLAGQVELKFVDFAGPAA